MNLEEKKIILYADDDLDDIEFLKEAFSSLEHEVELITCRNGMEALHYIKNLHPEENSPCLIILDINMPQLDGKQVLTHLRKLDRFAETPVVLFSTSSQASDKKFAEQYKAGFITKPLQVTEMTKIADTFVDHCTDEIKKSFRKQLL